ncbi:uncharacterized protein [Malus domestica]|uniref:uncharacterized protein n=1 Tax=Malus domestica TaxID=3750 RepID=UPI003976AE4C
MPNPCNVTERPNDASEAAEHTLTVLAPPDGDFWDLHVDGASNSKSLRASMVLATPNNSMLKQAITLGFKASNNEAEYEPLQADPQLETDLAVKKLAVHFDSQLIASQTTGEYMEKYPRMAQYLEKLCKQLEAFQTYTLTQVSRVDNAHVDTLAGLGSVLDNKLKHSILVEYLDKPSIEAELGAKVS